MKIFISWSGELSHAIAVGLRSWLQNVIQVVDPYVSSEDIEKGSRWFADIDKKLEESSFAIVCLTRENMSKPWILFEAGAVSRSINRSRVTPLLIDLSPAELSGPLAQFQATTISEADMLRLTKDIGNHLGDPRFSEALVERAFNKWWPDLKRVVNDALESLAENETEVEFRSDRAILEELLQTTRTLTQLVSSSEVEILKSPSRTGSVMERICEELNKRLKPLLTIALESADLVNLEGDELNIEFAPEGRHMRDTLSKPENMRVLRDVCSKVLGRNIGIRIATSDTGDSELIARSNLRDDVRSEQKRLRELAEQHPLIKQASHTFESEIKEVKSLDDEGK